MKLAAGVFFARVLPMFIMAGCASGGSGDGTDKGTGFGGPAVVNFNFAVNHYSESSHEGIRNLTTELTTALDLAMRNKELQEELQGFKSNDLEASVLKLEAGKALEGGIVDRAETLLRKAGEMDIESAKRSQSVADGRFIQAAATTKQLGDLKMTQLAYVPASNHYSAAVEQLPIGADRVRAEYLRAWGLALLSAGNIGKAETVLTKALAIREKFFGAEHLDVAQSLNNLAMVYQDQGRYADAQSLYQRALAIREKFLGQEHPDVAGSLNNLATIYQDQGRNADAKLLYDRALGIEEKVLGKDHPDVAGTLNNLANIDQEEGRFADAQARYERALAIDEKIFGKEHPNVAASLNNLANVYEKQGRKADAKLLYTRALAIQEKVLGKDHPDVAISLINLGNADEKQGRYADAESLYKRAITIQEQALGIEHPYLAKSLANYALLLRKVSRGAEAEKIEARVATIHERHAQNESKK